MRNQNKSFDNSTPENRAPSNSSYPTPQVKVLLTEISRKGVPDHWAFDVTLMFREAAEEID